VVSLVITSISTLFRFAKLEFEIQLQDDFARAGFLGSRLRGGYGLALLAQLCRRDDPLSCAASPQICECDYLRLFRPHRNNLKLKLVGAPLGNNQNLPATFVLDPPDGRECPYKSAERIKFSFIAIGPMCDFLEQSVKAFESFGKAGFIVDSHHRARFALVTVRNALVPREPSYKPGDSAAHAIRNTLDAVSLTPQFKSELGIRFSTPTRIENQNARRKDRETGLAVFSDFYDVVYNAAQRVGGLWQLYGEDWPGPTEFFRWRERLLKLSREITTIENNLKVIRLRGYSNMQEAPKPLDGFLGSMRFSGDLSPFFELLRIAEIVHLGSETTCGLGAFRVDNGE